MKITNTKSGPGGAHIGFSMFGARGPLREPEDGNSAAPASAPPPPAPAAPGDPAPPAPGTAASEKMLPQSQVSALIAAEKRDTEAKTRAKVLQEIKDAQTPAPKPAPKGDGSMSAEDVQRLLSRDRAFTRATATAGLNDRQLTRMESALKAEAPDDVAAWSAAYIEDLGLVKTPPPATAPNPAPNGTVAETKLAPIAPNAPVKVDPLTSGGLVNVFALSAEQIDQLGPQGVREHFEKTVAVGRTRLGAPPLPKLPARK